MSWTYKENPPSPNFAIITSRHYFNKILTIEILCSCLYFQAQIWFISEWSFSKYDNNNYYYHHHHHHHHHHLCTGYLQLYTGIKTIFFWGRKCCSYYVFTICATRNFIWLVKYVLYFDISTFRSMCAVHNMAVYCSYLVLCSAGLLLRFCLSYFEIIPVAPVFTGITSDFIFHVRWICVVRTVFTF
jgi:hypothetical protein